MSQALTLARPYARAAFGVASQEQAYSAWTDALAFAAHVAADPQVSGLLGDPKLTHGAAITLLSPAAASESFGRFLQLLADNRRLALLPEIAGLYEQLRAEAERVVKATVTSATPLPIEELQRITAALRQRFGREVEVSTQIDESLIGGAVIDAGDLVIDGSLRGKLQRLQASLAA